MSTKSIGLLVSFLLFVGVAVGSYFGVGYVGAKSNDDLTKLKGKNANLVKEIDEIGHATSQQLIERLNFYKDYFTTKSKMFVLEIFGLIEYSLPDNNFVDSISISKSDQTISLEFQSKDVQDLLRLYHNLEKVKKMGIITGYKMSDIGLDSQGGLRSTEIKKYKLTIAINPNIQGGNEQIIEFLKRYDDYYNKIYTGPMKKVLCETVIGDDGVEYCKTEDEKMKEMIEARKEAEKIREDEEKRIEKETTIKIGGIEEKKEEK